MIERTIPVGRWHVEFYFAGDDGYDIDTLLDRLWEFGASADLLEQALGLMRSGEPNTGFTFSNPDDLCAIVAIGPTTGGDEFQDTLVHEIHHLAVAVAAELGVDLEKETPAYIAGDSVRELADVICKLGCGRCRR